MRIATFNAENLFSRPKVLNFVDNDDAREPLNQLAKLDALLAKPKYGSADKTSILKLVNDLKALEREGGEGGRSYAPDCPP